MKKSENNVTVLLDKFCDESAQLSYEELRQLYFLLTDREEEERISQWMQQYWEENPEGYDKVNYERIFRQVKRQLNAGTPKRLQWLHFFQRSAAVLLFPLLGLSGYLVVQTIINGQPVRKEMIVVIPAEQEYMTPPGMRSKIMLPDSSVVWLNAASRLTVAKGFGKTQRHVTLAGEAYFEIARNEQKPFIVGTSDVDIQVLGTTFNLSAYPDEAPKAVLVEGSIEATIKDDDNRPMKKVRLQPDQLLKIKHRDQTTNIENNIDTKLYTSWTNGQLVFRQTPMEEVVKTLERWYSVRIYLHDNLLKQQSITGTFDNRTLEQVMSYISLSSSVRYKIDNNNETVNIYSKNT